MSGYEARRDKADSIPDREHHRRRDAVMSCAPRVRATGFASNPVVRFVARRLLYSIVVMLGVLVVVFMLVHLVPGDPVRIALGTRYTPQAYEALRSASGLDQPHRRAVLRLHRVRADRRPRGQLPQRRPGHRHSCSNDCPRPCRSPLSGIIIALLIALPAGIWSALHEGRVSDAIVRVTSQFGVSVPDFWMGILLIAVVRYRRCTGFRPPDIGRCSTTPVAGCGTSSCPVSRSASSPPRS